LTCCGVTLSSLVSSISKILGLGRSPRAAATPLFFKYCAYFGSTNSALPKRVGRVLGTTVYIRFIKGSYVLRCGEDFSVKRFNAAANVDFPSGDRVELCPNDDELDGSEKLSAVVAESLVT
jgi:hypothetical protein